MTIITGQPEQARQLLSEIEAASKLNKAEFAAAMQSLGIPVHGTKGQMIKQATGYINRRAVTYVQTH